MLHLRNENICDEVAIVLGNFDGIHIGHKKLITEARKFTVKNGFALAAFSFSPHPVSVLGNTGFGTILTSDEKALLFSDIGVDFFIEYPFDLQFASMPPCEFIMDILLKKYNCCALFAGESFRFGKNQVGDGVLLKKIASRAGVHVEIIPDLKTVPGHAESSQKISSNTIREMIRKNNFKLAAEHLGYPFFFMGKVVHGKKIGRVIGFPTLNLLVPKDKLLPKNGVYITYTHIDGDVFPGITNVGVRPTLISTEERTVETYIFEFDRDVYNKIIRIEFIKWIRDETAFNNIDELKQQIKKDAENAKQWLSNKGFAALHH